MEPEDCCDHCERIHASLMPDAKLGFVYHSEFVVPVAMSAELGRSRPQSFCCTWYVEPTGTGA